MNKNQHTAEWTEEREEALSRLWLRGRSASEIAAAIGGVSRCAVIGKVHRLGIADRSVAAVVATGPVGPPRRSAFALAEFDPVIARVITAWTNEISKTNTSNEQVESKDD